MTTTSYNSYSGVLGYCLMPMYGQFIEQGSTFILLSLKAEWTNNISAPVSAEYYSPPFRLFPPIVQPGLLRWNDLNISILSTTIYLTFISHCFRQHNAHLAAASLTTHPMFSGLNLGNVAIVSGSSSHYTSRPVPSARTLRFPPRQTCCYCPNQQ